MREVSQRSFAVLNTCANVGQEFFMMCIMIF